MFCFKKKRDPNQQNPRTPAMQRLQGNTKHGGGSREKFYQIPVLGPHPCDVPRALQRGVRRVRVRGQGASAGPPPGVRTGPAGLPPALPLPPGGSAGPGGSAAGIGAGPGRSAAASDLPAGRRAATALSSQELADYCRFQTFFCF